MPIWVNPYRFSAGKPPVSRRGRACIIKVWLMVMVMVLPMLAGCREKEPIKVGYVGCLTGRLSDLGISGRDGVLMSVEQINRAGGIRGREVVMVVRDDQNNAKIAVEVDRELIREGVVAIIGHMTSAMCIAALPIMNQEKVLMISPTGSKDSLKGLDDFLIRMVPPNRSETDHLVQVARERFHLKNMAVVYDLSNRAYSEEFFNNYCEELKKQGGAVTTTCSFTSGVNGDLKGIALKLLEDDPDGILVICGALDAAIICQHLRNNGFSDPIFSSGWAMTSDFIQHAGPAAEGVIFSHLINENCQEETYLSFKNHFWERFGYQPNFSAVYAYEAAGVLFTTLAKDGSYGALKKNILEHGYFTGLQGEIALDRFGDPRRGRFLISVVDGEYRNLE